MTEKQLRLVARDAVSVIVHDDFRHTLGEIFELELNDDAVRIRVHAIPNEFRKRLYRLGTRLPSHKVIFDLDLDVFDLCHGEQYHKSTIISKKEQKAN